MALKRVPAIIFALIPHVYKGGDTQFIIYLFSLV